MLWTRALGQYHAQIAGLVHESNYQAEEVSIVTSLRIKRSLLLPRFAVAVGGTVLLLSACGQDPVQSQSPKGPMQRPIQIVGVTPDENVTVVDRDIVISARFQFLSGPRPILPGSLRLLVDSLDVTQGSRIAATEDVPASRGEISFTPTQPLAPGKHSAMVHFANDQNEKFSYAWDFSVRR